LNPGYYGHGRGQVLPNFLIKYHSITMAQTEEGKKKVYVHPHTKDDGTKVPPHYRSTPKTSNGPGPSKKK
jgi:hypothetical protein